MLSCLLCTGCICCPYFMADIPKPNFSSECCWMCGDTWWMYVLRICAAHALTTAAAARNPSDTPDSEESDGAASTCK
jgi:hypothetical protein